MSSPNLSEFHDTFFDEAHELLQSMEEMLLVLNPAGPDHESLNAIFRCAHSIKGGAAAFGVFDDLVNTTHKLENILDLIRNHKLPLTHESISVFLKAKDVLWDLVQAYREQREPDTENANKLLAMLAQVAENKTAQAVTAGVDTKPLAGKEKVTEPANKAVASTADAPIQVPDG